jgi:hypothetical protein
MQTLYENPLDELFEVDPGNHDDHQYSQITETKLQPPVVIPAAPEKDGEDVETDRKIDEVFDTALGAYQNQSAMIEIMDPRYAARNAEVAATYLNIALQAAGMKAKVKSDRKRNNAFIPGMGNKITNNTIVATREEILRMISVDAETKAV